MQYSILEYSSLRSLRSIIFFSLDVTKPLIYLRILIKLKNILHRVHNIIIWLSDLLTLILGLLDFLFVLLSDIWTYLMKVILDMPTKLDIYILNKSPSVIDSSNWVLLYVWTFIFNCSFFLNQILLCWKIVERVKTHKYRTAHFPDLVQVLQ